MLTPKQIAQYHEDGYVVPDYQVPPDVLEAIKARPAVVKAYAAAGPSYAKPITDEERKVLFGQDAKTVKA